MSDSQWQDGLFPVLRTLQIIVAGLVTGCVLFLVVALVISSQADTVADTPLVSYIAIGGAAMALLARVMIPPTIVAAGRREILEEQGRIGDSAKALDQAAATARLLQSLQTATIVACALIEGAAFFLLVAYLVEHWLTALLVAVAMIVILALHMPTRSRVVHWLANQLTLLKLQQQFNR